MCVVVASGLFVSGCGAVSKTKSQININEFGGGCAPRKLPGTGGALSKRLGLVEGYMQPPYEAEKISQTLSDLISKIDDYNRYEQSQIYSFSAYDSYINEDYEKALELYKLVVAQSPLLPCQIEIEHLYSIVELSYSLEMYTETAVYLEKWKQLTTSITAENYALMANVYFELNMRKQSLENINRAISRSKLELIKPKKRWLELSRTISYLQRDYSAALLVTKELDNNYPSSEFEIQIKTLELLIMNKKNDTSGG